MIPSKAEDSTLKKKENLIFDPGPSHIEDLSIIAERRLIMIIVSYQYCF